MKTKRIISVVALSMIIAVLNIAPVLAVEQNNANTSTTNTTNTTQSTTTNVSKTITKDYTFTTETKPFKYDAPKTVKENGYEYKYKDISYKETSSTQPVTTSKSYTNLTSKSVPNSISYNGKTLYLKETPTYTAHTTPAQKSTKTVTETKTYNGVVPGTESSVIKNTVKKDGITLKKSSQSYTSTTANYTDLGTLASYDHDYWVSGTNIQLTDGTPEQGDWQSDLHSYFELPSSTTITSVSWATDIQHQSGSGKYTRSVRYSGQRTLYNYTVRYSGTTTVVTSPEKTTYSATAVYTSKDKTKYSVTATATYELTEESLAKLEEQQRQEQEQQEQMENGEDETSTVDEEEQKRQEEEAKQAEEERLKAIEQKEREHKRNILIGCGLGLLALAGLFTILYFVGRKKKEEDENDIDQILTKASSIKDNKNTAKKESEKERAAQQKREQAQKEKEERARKAAEEKEKRRLEKQQAMEQKKQENIKRQENAEKSDFMKKLDQIKHDIATDDEIKK